MESDVKETRFKKHRWARGTSRPKLDLRLATLVELGPSAFGDRVDRLERKRQLSRGGALAFLGGDLVASRHEAAHAPPFASVFVTAESPDALDRLEKKLADPKEGYRSATTRILSKAGNIATAEVALDDLEKLEEERDVSAIEWTGAFRPLSDDGDGAGAVLSPRASIGLEGAPAELDGKGTIIGIVDVEGLDFYHPCFISDSGTTRVLALWDQRAPKPTVVPGEEAQDNGLPRRPYGRVYGREALQHEVLASQPEPYSEVPHIAWKGSHGTKTAGLAMGLAWDRPEARGVAPGAELVFVGTFSSGVGALGSMAEMADALAFVFEVADAKKKPCVVNVSMGDDLGPRDGTSPVERFIDQLVSKPGRAVVVAAGNSAQKGHHRRVALEDGQTRTVEIDVGERNTDRIAMEIWYPATEEGESVEVEIEAPGEGNRTGRIPTDGRSRAFDHGKTRILVASTSRAAGAEANGFIRLEILGLSSDEPLLHGTWKVHLAARGAPREAHAWIDHRYVRFAGSGDEETTLTTPATSCKAITVGAYDVGRKEPHDFSGKGPCRGAHPKPDILAPGGPLWVPSAMTAVRYVPATGTSMAAPLVTGAVALAFQRHGRDLRSDQVLSTLLPPGAGQTTTGEGLGVLDLSYFLAQGGNAEER